MENPFEAVRAVMLQNLEMMAGATQSYIDMVERTLRAFPGANEEQIGTFKAYIERQVAVYRHFAEELLGAKDFREASGIQTEYLKTCAEDATLIGAKIAGPFKTFVPLSNYLGEQI